MMKFANLGLGASVTRYEDQGFLTGRGCFTADIVLKGEAQAYVLRSDHANARIVSVDAAAATAAPGVLAVFTGEDVGADGLGTLPCLRTMKKSDGSPMYEPPRPLLNRRFVRYVGDYVALIVAETAHQAQDAAELIEVDYDPLPATISLAQILAANAPSLRADCPDNRCFHYELGDKTAVERAFAQADHVTRLDLTITRVQPSPLEPRAAIGQYDPAQDKYTLYAGVQSPHRIRDVLARSVLKVPQGNLRVISPDMGGAFGNRNTPYHELGLVLWAARKIGRPVKWTSGRSESFLCDDQGRDNVTTAELALDCTGRFLALRARTAAAMGAYLSANSPGPAVANLGCLAGVYRIPAIHVEVDAYFTNTNSTGPYRGAGRPEAIYVLERLIDTAARELAMDPSDLRRYNLITPADLPYETALTHSYDSGDFPKNMDQALARASYADFDRRRADSRARGRLRGIGIANAIESAGKAGSSEFAEMRIDATGRMTLFVGTRCHGQGHDTVYRQLVSEFLGLDFADIEVVQGDTDLIETGVGTFGSRSLTLGGGALKAAAERIVEQGRQLAAAHFEAAVADVEFADGDFAVAGTNRRISLTSVAQMAGAAKGGASEGTTGLSASATYQPDATTFPNGCHVSEVEVDPETGAVRILRYVVVDDFGTVVNPLLVDGQVHGGVAQGIGQVIMEQVLWDQESGQLLTGSFMDYAMPRASDLPGYEVAMNPCPTSKNSLGIKGAGEAGCVGALACLMNAIVDALSQAGVPTLDMPATPERIWRALQGLGPDR